MWIVAGLFLGAWLTSITGQWFGLWWGFDGVLVGAVLGALAGAAVQRWKGRSAEEADRVTQLEARLGRLEADVARLRAGVIDPGTAAEGGPAPQAKSEAIVTPSPEMTDTPTVPAAESAPAAPARVPRRGADVLAARRGAPAPVAAAASEPSTLDALYERARAWLLGGNTVVRVGLLVLFFGLAFLARYAVENSLLPIELRLAGIALGAIVLLGLGWRLRHQRSGYAISLQGGGVATLYLTIFAAMRLYQMIPPMPGFALLLAVVVFSTALAVWQNAQALAIIGTAGGFMAPILACTGEGSHVMLFSYYLLLNAGVLAVAWHKAWRGLNLVGFLFTFSIALAWGARDYRAELFASTEPFLIAFVLMYIAAAMLFAWRRAPALNDTVDGTLVFGTPVVGFGLQAALVEGMPYGLAWSALAAGGVYIVLARALHARARPTLRLLVESFLALGVAFLTLTIPLAVDGQWTAAAWAMEGAALLWVGTRQSRKLAIAAGLVLQAAAGVFFVTDGGIGSGMRAWPLLNSLWMGALLMALAGFVSSRIADRARHSWPRLLSLVAPLLLVWATLWWLVGGLQEMEAWLGRREMVAATLAFFAFSGALATWLARRLDWPALHWPGLLALPGMALALLMAADVGTHPAAGWGAPTWALAVAAAVFGLRRGESAPALGRVLGYAHTALLWLVTLAAAWSVADVVDQAVVGSSWAMAGVLAVAALAVLGVLWLAAHEHWPVAAWRDAWVLTGAGGVVGAGVLGALVMSFASDGDVAPLPYVPLLNPLDLTLLLLLFVAWRWWQALGAVTGGTQRAPTGRTRRMLKGLAAVAFVLANGILLRAVHHLADVPWSDGALFASDTVQTSLSLFWGVLGLALTFFGSRRHQRTLWMVGAALLGVVVAKLFLVDMASTGTVARIVSFLGAGVLLLVVGYLSPLPPAREAAA